MIGALTRAIESRFRPSKDDYARAGLFGFASGGFDSIAGRKVGPTQALAERTFYTCTRILCEDLSSLPCLLYEIDEDDPRQKDRATAHPLYWLLKEQANPEMTAQDLVDFQMASLLLRGNAVASIERDEAGRRVGLWPLRWDYIELSRHPETQELLFTYQPTALEAITFRRRDVWFIRGPVSLDGIRGLSIVDTQRETIGEALAQQEFNARFYSNGAAPRGVLQTPNKLSDAAFERVKSSWAQAQQGLSNAQKVAFLEEGLEWKAMGMSPEDAQLLGQMKYSREVIPGFFRIPAPLVNSHERSGLNNTEQLIRAYAKFALMPWAERFEQTGKRDLLTPFEKRRYQIEMKLDQLLRGDPEARSRAHWRGRMGGWLSKNEIRADENLPPVENGDELLDPLNMAVASAAGDMGGMGGGSSTGPAEQ